MANEEDFAMINTIEILKIVKIIRGKINDDTDIVWTKYESAKILQAELDADIQKLEQGDLSVLPKLNLMFLPTSTFQEISIANDWEQEFISLSEIFDDHYKKLISNKSGLE